MVATNASGWRERGRYAGNSVFDRLAIKPVINASGTFTDLGGSIISREIWARLTELNGSYVDIPELLGQAGKLISAYVESEAARPVPSASAGIALAVAACMTKGNPPAFEKLPSTADLERDEVVLQRAQADKYLYINPIRLTGATIRLAGTRAGTTIEELSKAMNERTAALFVPAHLEGLPGTMALTDVLELGRNRGVPVVVDAAYQFFPPARAAWFNRVGVDLVCYSAKYYRGPNSGGFVSGRAELIETIAGLDFTCFESGPFRTFGRPFKMGRYEIAAVALALEEWFAMDHTARAAAEARRALKIARRLGNRNDIRIELRRFTLDARLVDEEINAVVLKPVAEPARRSAELQALLAHRNPSIRALLVGENLVLVTESLRDHEVRLVTDAIAQLLAEELE